MAYNHMRVTKDKGGRFQSFAQQFQQERAQYYALRGAILAQDPAEAFDCAHKYMGEIIDQVVDLIPDRQMEVGLWSWGLYEVLNAWQAARMRKEEITTQALTDVFERAVASMAAELEAARAAL